MSYRIRADRITKNLIPVTPSGTTAVGMIKSTDIGTLVSVSSQNARLFVNTTETSNAPLSMVGIVAAVPNESTAGSTTLFYYQPILKKYEEVEVDYAKPGTTTHGLAGSTANEIKSTNIGYLFGPRDSTTDASIEAGKLIDPSKAVKVLNSTTKAQFLRMTGFSTNRGVIYGVIDSSHLR